jgi:hypothetical protein
LFHVLPQLSLGEPSFGSTYCHNYHLGSPVLVPRTATTITWGAQFLFHVLPQLSLGEPSFGSTYCHNYHLGSPVLVPRTATTSLSICNWLKELVNEECVISRLRRQSRAVSRKWETKHASITKLSLFKNAFQLCQKMYPVQHNYTITQNTVTQLYSHLCHLKTRQ